MIPIVSKLRYLLFASFLVLQPPDRFWFDWQQPNTSTIRTYRIYGGVFTAVAERDQQSQEQTIATLAGNAERGYINFQPRQACWTITLEGDDPAVNNVWAAPACNRLWFPYVVSR